MPAPRMATGAPCHLAGIDPNPAGCVIQSSNGNGKSGPKIVTGPCSRSMASSDGMLTITAPQPHGTEPVIGAPIILSLPRRHQYLRDALSRRRYSISTERRALRRRHVPAPERRVGVPGVVVGSLPRRRYGALDGGVIVIRLGL